MEIYDLSSLDKLPDTQWLIDGFIPGNACVIMYGLPATGKTFLALDICFNLLQNKTWYGNKVSTTNGGLVFYLIGEGVGGAKKRIATWHKYYKKDYSNRFFIIPINNLLLWKLETVKSIIKNIRDYENKMKQKTVFVVVDTLIKAISGLDENSSKDISGFLAKMDFMISELGCTVMLIHHAGKDVSKGMRGSSALLGAIDTSFYISKDKNIVNLQTTKQKDGEGKDLKFKLVKFGDSLVIDSPTSQKEWAKDEDLKFHECLIKAGMNFETIASKLSRTRDEVKYRFMNFVKMNGMTDAQDIFKKYNITDKNDMLSIQSLLMINKDK